MAHTPQEIRAAIEDVARQIYAARKSAHARPAEWEPTSPQQFPQTDPTFYDSVAATLASQGFRPLGDFEDVTKRGSDTHSFWQFLLSGDGVVVASLAHVRSQGRRRLREVEVGEATNVKCISLTTEFTDGAFLITDNLKGRGVEWPRPAGWTVQRLGQAAPVTSLLAVHEAERCRLAEPPLRRAPVALPDVADVQNSSERYRSAMNQHLRDAGYLDERLERKRWLEVMTPDVAAMLAEEITRLRRNDDPTPGKTP
jgi:hypothetical protein